MTDKEIIEQFTAEEVAGMLSTLDFRPAEHHPADCLPMARRIIAHLASVDAVPAEEAGTPNAVEAVEHLTAPADDFYKSFDARVWARGWLDAIAKNPSIPTDEGTMIGWFANALMRGYDEYHWTHPPALPTRAEVEAAMHNLIVGRIGAWNALLALILTRDASAALSSPAGEPTTEQRTTK